jgi:serine/threonine-protein kinase RsbW
VPTGGAAVAEASSAPQSAVSVASAWRCSRVFPASSDQVAQARRFLGRFLADCPLADDALLICSELATNAIVHSESGNSGGWFALRAEVRDRDYVWLEIEDQGGRWAGGQVSDEGGRGLEIVALLASYWDVRGDDTGRVVCARLDWTSTDGEAPA